MAPLEQHLSITRSRSANFQHEYRPVPRNTVEGMRPAVHKVQAEPRHQVLHGAGNY